MSPLPAISAPPAMCRRATRSRWSRTRSRTCCWSENRSSERRYRSSLVARLKSLLIRFWNIISRPSSYLSLGFLTLGGFVCGVLFWGAFNTGLELTNTEKFCTSCHEMRDNVFQELQQTAHFSNRSGVRATCPDCHVPHEWTAKIARKMQASKEVWGKIFGTIDTRKEFQHARLH